MRKPLLDQFKVVHHHTKSLLDDMKLDILSIAEADFIERLESISTVLGVLIDRVEAGRPREPRYDAVYFEGLARLDADARGEPK